MARGALTIVHILFYAIFRPFEKMKPVSIYSNLSAAKSKLADQLCEISLGF